MLLSFSESGESQERIESYEVLKELGTSVTVQGKEGESLKRELKDTDYNSPMLGINPRKESLKRELKEERIIHERVFNIVNRSEESQ